MALLYWREADKDLEDKYRLLTHLDQSPAHSSGGQTPGPVEWAPLDFHSTSHVNSNRFDCVLNKEKERRQGIYDSLLSS